MKLCIIIIIIIANCILSNIVYYNCYFNLCILPIPLFILQNFSFYSVVHFTKLCNVPSGELVGWSITVNKSDIVIGVAILLHFIMPGHVLQWCLLK